VKAATAKNLGVLIVVHAAESRQSTERPKGSPRAEGTSADSADEGFASRSG
jgi:hypothetical protein